MFALLKVRVSGFRMLKDDFEISFVSRARAETDQSDSSEFFEVAEGLRVFTIVALTGSNSSGKTTVLSLLNNVFLLMKTGRWLYQKDDFSNQEIRIHLEFFINGVIYLYDSAILPVQLSPEAEPSLASYCTIRNETIRQAIYKPSAGKRYAEKLNFEEDHNATGLDDTSVLVFFCKQHVRSGLLRPFPYRASPMTATFFNSLNFFNDELTLEIIRLLDDSIETIKYVDGDDVEFKRFGQDAIHTTRYGVLSLLSNGTIKGIELYIRATLFLKNGGVLLIDEIENCFHKNLVNNLLFLFTDKTINRKNAQLVFSTHYSEILDVFNRRDNVYILHRNGSTIEISNLYSDYEVRTELSKSKRFNDNTFGTLLNYERLMNVKRLIRREVSRND